MGQREMAIRITLLIIICILFWSPRLIAEVPHQFKNGEVADANDINENFSFLDKKLESVQNNQNSSTDSELHEYTRDQVQVEPGHTFNVSGESYVVIGYPVADVGTKERILLLLPVLTCDQNSAPSSCNSSKPSQSIRVSHTGNVSIDKNFEVNGYPASINIEDRRTYKNHLERDSDSDGYIAKWTVQERQFANVSLFINESWVSFNLDLPRYDKNIQDKTISDFKASYQNVIDWSKAEEHTINVKDIFKLINRINIQSLNK